MQADGFEPQDQGRADSPVLGSYAPNGPEPLELDQNGHVIDLGYLRDHPSAALPPSPFDPSNAGMRSRPRAPTPSASLSPAEDDCWSPSSVQQFSPLSPQASYLNMESPVSIASPNSPSTVQLSHPHSPVVRPSSFGDDSSFLLDGNSARLYALTAKIPGLPDPSQFPDPYPFRRPNNSLNSPGYGFSSGGSSSASTRSSAYTSGGSALASSDHSHTRIESDVDEPNQSVGVAHNDVLQPIRDLNTSASFSQSHQYELRPWSSAGGSRSRSSSIGNSNTNPQSDHSRVRSQGEPSFDTSWYPVDERDELGLTSDEETDDDLGVDLDVEGLEDDDRKEEDVTAAVVVVEEGRGLIVQGEGLPVSSLQVQAGTTHLLLASSSTPNAIPSFLTGVLPQISSSILVLDISANFLSAIPPALASCVNLEELNIAYNPLRALPIFLANLTSLRVLIADKTGITTLPFPLSALEKLHTLSIRQNKLHSLPSWFCLLPSLQTLLVEGNPFQGPWKALVDPLLAKTPMTPPYPPSTPVFPLPSASIPSSTAGTETDIDDFSEPSSPVLDARLHLGAEDEDTITPARAPALSRAATSPPPTQSNDVAPVAPPLSRTRTTPNRAYYDKTRPNTAYAGTKSKGVTNVQHPPSQRIVDSGYFGDRDLRKMKSAGDLRKGSEVLTPALADTPPTSTPRRPLIHMASSSNLLSSASQEAGPSVLPKRYASLGVASGSPRPRSGSRPKLSNALWDKLAAEEDEDAVPVTPPSARMTSQAEISPPIDRYAGVKSRGYDDDVLEKGIVRPRKPKEEKERGSKWGFLKKMSMSKMRTDSPSASRPSSRPTTAQGGPLASPFPNGTSTVPAHAALRPTNDRQQSQLQPDTPQIDVRISTTGALGSIPASSHSNTAGKHSPSSKLAPLTGSSHSSPSSALLLPTSPTGNARKRRSFLPIDAPPSDLNIPIPSPSAFVPGITAIGVDDEHGKGEKLLFNSEGQHSKAEDRGRDAYARALRSVMAYLKDMHDLGSSQGSILSVYGSPVVDGGSSTVGFRRPTLVEGGRVTSDGSIASTSSMSSSQLRSPESSTMLRAGSATQTLSVATTESGGSGQAGEEERKYKDNKGKRGMIVREIIETERTYVKGLQELVDIYIKPACAPANVLSGVGSNKETVVPAGERKIVFGGLEALFSFHKESFLPALERAAAPLMKPASALAETDADGRLSSDAARAVAGTFVSHAAFMKMYSTYINNFDNSVQRIKYWSSSRTVAAGSPPSAMSPSSSTAQLVGLGLTMSAVTTPGVMPDGTLSGSAPLTTSQRKRIKTYLKRCRLNPRHSQLNLEGYLLLPVQRIPRYRLLLEELVKCTAPVNDYTDDPLDRALAEITTLATSMNEGKRESESRRKLVQWQSRIRGKFPSPLVQPHRRLIMDGPLQLTRVVRKATVPFETLDTHGDATTIQVECLMPELTPRSLMGVLCNDLLVLCRDPSEGRDPNCQVDLWAVLRMQTLPQPCSIVHGNALRIVDNKAILYFDVPSSSDALNWFRAINLHIPASKA
ncbi:hypothetical protein GLOTRDRAFT_53441 [Gloeophyllum trabeum ATCC 11539]|uniref:DH domain-containing protein n=1 Tax=Gloeophyllum trabeum (strain ATCC 11539 / FP-39264 / Madison 617) TaxID=670483 RepID=S7QN76_GLOTA|nr:uncharacterized protein GLOTRDRAFT_53441 [Gloeophyllum trabeum ATCC 11539]EPQ60882.1 hypothetical protein GLOTRDRAFT_53441 [Gloeophyllum trabeum ATCC 11539]